MRTELARLLEGLGLVWVIIFASTLGWAMTTLGVRPSLPDGGAAPILRDILRLGVLGWLGWTLVVKVWHPVLYILDREELGSDRFQLLHDTFRAGVRRGLSVALVFVPACIAPSGIPQVVALLGALAALLWFDRDCPRLASRLMHDARIV